MTSQAVAMPAEIVHQLPHRTRLRVPRAHRSPETMAAVSQKLMAVPGVREVELNRTTGSVLIHHARELGSTDALAEALGEPTALVFDLVPPRQRAVVAAEASALGHLVRVGLTRLDVWLLHASHGWIDLKMFVPLAFVGLAALQVALTEGGLSDISPLILLYLAFDAYLKFHELFPERRPLPAS